MNMSSKSNDAEGTHSNENSDCEDVYDKTFSGDKEPLNKTKSNENDTQNAMYNAENISDIDIISEDDVKLSEISAQNEDRKNKNPSKEYTTGNDNKDESYRIRFIAYASPEFSISRSFFIDIKDLEQDNKERAILYIKELSGGGLLLNHEYTIKKECYDENKSLSYIYGVSYYDDKGKYELKFEHVFKNRIIYMKNIVKGKIYECYDGVILPQSNSNQNETAFIKSHLEKHKTNTIYAMLDEILCYMTNQTQTNFNLSKFNFKYISEFFGKLLNCIVKCFTAKNSDNLLDFKMNVIQTVIDRLYVQSSQQLCDEHTFIVSIGFLCFIYDITHEIYYSNKILPSKCMVYVLDALKSDVKLFSKHLGVLQNQEQKEIYEKFLDLYRNGMCIHAVSINIIQLLYFLTIGNDAFQLDNYNKEFILENKKFFNLRICLFQDVIKTNNPYQFLTKFENIYPVLMITILPNIIFNKDFEKFLPLKINILHLIIFLYDRIYEKKNLSKNNQFPTYQKFQTNEDAITKFNSLFVKLEEKFIQEDASLYNIDYLELLHTLTDYILNNFDILKIFIQNVKMEIRISIIIGLIKLIIHLDHIKGTKKQNEYNLEKILENCLNKIELKIIIKEAEKLFEIWNTLLDFQETLGASTSNVVKTIVSKHCEKKFKECSLQTILDYAVKVTATNNNHDHNTLKETIFKVILNKIDHTTTKGMVDELTKLLRDNSSLIKKFTDKVFHVKWPKSGDSQMKILEFLFECIDFIKTISSIVSSGKLKDEDINTKLAQIKSLIVDFIKKLRDGNITCNDVVFLEKKKDTFIDICQFYSKDIKEEMIYKETDALDMYLECMITCRIQQIKHFNWLYKLMHSFFKSILLQVGESYVDTKALQLDINNYKDFKKFTFNELYNSFDYSQMKIVSNDDTNKQFLNKYICGFQILKNIDISTLEKIISILYGTWYIIFDHIINETLNSIDCKGVNVSIESYLENVLNPSLNKYNDMAKRLCDGKIQFNEIRKYKEKAGTDWKEFFTDMIKSVTAEENLVKKRLEQIESFYKLQNISEITNILSKLKGEFELIGDFTDLNTIMNTMDKNGLEKVQIKDINENILDLFIKLKKLNDEKIVNCLKAFLDNITFIKWLKNNIKSVNEIQVLVNVASEAENEGTFDIIRLQTLLTVGRAYAPLIYGLKKESSFADLIEKIEQITINFKNVEKLSSKIKAVSKHQSWLEEIIKNMGNVGANSLEQAQRILMNGIYTIGFSHTQFSHTNNLTIENIIKLTINDSNQEKEYSYGELNDLQDRLTLVASESTEQQQIIEEYQKMFEAVTNLASIYLNLLKSGNILFKEWTANIYNNKNYHNTIKINFGLNEENKNIIGKRELEKNTSESINKVQQYLEICYTKWQSYLDQKRQEYPLLNYFTTQQLAFLRKKLSNINNLDYISSNNRCLNDLLSHINKSLTQTLIDEAHQYASSTVRKAEDHKKLEIKNLTDELKEEIMEQCEIMGFPLSLIQEAMINVKSDDSTDYFNYCLEKNDAYEKRLETTVVFESVQQSVIPLDFDDSNNNADEANLEVKLKKLWRTFTDMLSKNYNEFISLDHLGNFLNHLKSKSNRNIQRRKPPYLEINVPNLIVCDEYEIIARLMEIYIYSDEQLLPSDDEVFFCTNTTIADDIEIFLRRATQQDSERKIYCLVNAHDLPYDEANKVSQMYEKFHKTKTKEEYLLCIICSTEKEDRSVLVTQYSRYRKKLPKDINYNRIENYLRDKFHIDQINGLDKPAGLVERDKLTTRIITSQRSGVGKSLYAKRLFENVENNVDDKAQYCCIPVKQKQLNVQEIFDKLKTFDTKHFGMPRIFHFDIAYEVWYNVDIFLCQLLCLSAIHSSTGEVWRRSKQDVYLIEIMAPAIQTNDNNNSRPLHSILNFLPTIHCLTPFQIYEKLNNPIKEKITTFAEFDEEILRSDEIQRPCQYLDLLEKDQNGLNEKMFDKEEFIGAERCLELLLKHSEINNPSWSEIIHFTNFLNIQLEDSERSVFCSHILVGDTLPGFKSFVVKFMIQMSHDFALPSLEISDRSALQLNDNFAPQFEINQVQMRRKWETNPHPYLFFNPDGQTFTFFGFYVSKPNGQLVDPISNKIVFHNLVLSETLIRGIDSQDKKILSENIAKSTKIEKIKKLINIMGKRWAVEVPLEDGTSLIRDPDPSYELTMDNVLKMMAIYMRFRCNIPVIIMGETGCGKTRLIKYLCDLQKNPNSDVEINNMYLVKVHGGVTSQDITRHVENAQKLAAKNRKIDPEMFTILFFDEANTTEAIGTIKEIMCDGRINGEMINLNYGLKIIAACNPYKKHSEEIIKKFEQSGLGFYLDNDKTTEKLGNLPMRHLVYRVQPLPTSMLPIIWDFGQLNDEVERLYIAQIVTERFSNTLKGLSKKMIELTIKVLSESQKFMKKLQSESSIFVSLRNVQRTLKVIEWFLKNFLKSNSYISNTNLSTKSESIIQENETNTNELNLDINYPEDQKFIKSTILALNACYHVSLQSNEMRKAYRLCMVDCFQDPLINEMFLLDQFEECYNLLLEHIDLPEAIARNQALKENIFMMVVCIELKIPLFIIGKPGSSKSLAKTLIAQKMQGSKIGANNIFNNLKEAHLMTFQCSPLSTSEKILKAFRQCAKFQLARYQDLERYVSVVVLDEIGLAEASTSMPLKVLHPLLEEGVEFDDEEEMKLIEGLLKKNDTLSVDKIRGNNEWHKVGFMGISNWVLDPAKMNRGIVLNRCEPNTFELKEIAEGICNNDKNVINSMKIYLPSLLQGYINLCQNARNELKREYFGLRDFYSLFKMIYYEVKEKHGSVNMQFLERAIRRNFGGFLNVNSLEIFLQQFQKDQLPIMWHQSRIYALDLIKEALNNTKSRKTVQCENRYLLLIAENENVLELLTNDILESKYSKEIKIIFGSSFRSDQHYTQICKQIHQIKLSMESGGTVVLLNLENLYESLYELLNQFFQHFDDMKLVDLGLGTQRSSCLVHENFRLIVIADKKAVCDPKKYPIPLINRLEKHCLSIEVILNDRRKVLVKEIQLWCETISYASSIGITANKVANKLNILKPADIFIGFTDDTVASLVLKFSKQKESNRKIKDNLTVDENDDEEDDEDEYEWLDASEEIKRNVKAYLLQCATADGIIRLDQQRYNQKMTTSKTNNEELDEIMKKYFKDQYHTCFTSFLNALLDNKDKTLLSKEHLIQITTHSKLLSVHDLEKFKNICEIRHESLLSFNSQQQFIDVLKEFLTNVKSNDKPRLLIIQCDCANFYPELVSCTRYTIVDQYEKHDSLANINNAYIILIVQIPKIAGGCFSGFQTAKWLCYHIDDLEDDLNIGNMYDYREKSLSQIFHSFTNRDLGIKSINLLRFLEVSVYSICAKIKNVSKIIKSMDVDTKDSANRTIQRVQILKNLFKNDNNEFRDALMSTVAKLQEEREMKFSSAESWLYSEVVQMNNLIKYGTLKMSSQHYIENRLSILIAGVIAFVDENNNLDRLVSPSKDWITQFWYAFYKYISFNNIQYSRCYLQSNGSERSEFICKNKVNIPQDINFQLPFSWCIKNMIDTFYSNCLQNRLLNEELGTDRRTNFNRLMNSFVGSTQYLSLDKLLSEFKISEILSLYINDYLLLAHDQILNEYHLGLFVKRIFFHISENYSEKLDNPSILVAIHMAYEDLSKEFELFSQFIYYDSSGIIVSYLKEKDNQINGSVNLCFIASNIICQSLEPTQDIRNWSQWFRNVLIKSYLIDKYMKLFSNELIVFSNINDDNLIKFKSLWEHVMTLKLFIEHVCEKKAEYMYTYCINLWNHMKKVKQLDYKTVETLQQLAKFPKTILRGHDAIYKKRFTCAGCNSNLCPQDLLYELNFCKCVLCQNCYTEFQRLRICPKCNRKIENEADLSTFKLFEYKSKRDAYVSLKDSMDTFFVDLVSTLCLNENDLPNNEVIDFLIEQILPKQKNNDDDNIDLNTNIKSTLLQLLMKYKSKNVDSCIKSLFERSKEVLQTYEHSDLAELKSMYVNAIEDNIHLSLLENNENENGDIIRAIELLNGVISNEIKDQDDIISNLNLIANIKFSLTICANVFNDYDVNHVAQQKLLIKSRQMIENFPSKWPRFFLIKQIFRRYDKRCFLNASKHKNLNWILSDGLLQTNCITDNYVIYGDKYRRIRTLLNETFAMNNIENLINCEITQDECILYILAIFKNITLTGITSTKQKECDKLLTIIASKNQKYKKCLEMVLKKINLPTEFVQQEGYWNIALVLVHLYVTLLSVDLPELHLFKGLLVNPDNFQNQYFPGMPEDSDFDAYNTFKKSEKSKTKLYKCSQGHVYAIGECTKPWVTSKCPTCKETIGGNSHRLASNNTEAEDLQDNTKFGYCLPFASQRFDNCETIREMSPLYTTLIRLMLSSTLYLSSVMRNENKAFNIVNDVKFNNPNDVRVFFADQILKDVKILSNCLQHSTDESLLLVHYFLKKLNQLKKLNKTNNQTYDLKSKESRRKYEQDFCAQVFDPIFKNRIEQKINKITQALKVDSENNDNDRLFRIAYNLIQPEMGKINFLDETKCWSYRIQISVDHMINTLFSTNKNDKSLSLLHKFIQQMQQLEIIKYLPDIVQMVKLLYGMLNRQIDRQEAKELTIGALLDRNEMNTSSKEIIINGANSFTVAWRKARTYIEKIFIPNILDRLNLNNPELNVKNVNDLKLSFLLSSTSKKDGRYMYALIFYLCALQNEFMQYYKTWIIDKQVKLDTQVEESEYYSKKTDLMNLIKDNCIMFTREKEILKIVYLHSNYSLSVSKALTMEYNFHKIQSAIETKLIARRLMIEIKSIPIFEFCDELSDIKHLEDLDNIIPQEELEESVKEKLFSHYKRPNQVTSTLRIVRIVIDFIVSSNSSTKMKITDYAINILKMQIRNDGDICRKIFDLEMKHLRSLWLTLSLHRTMLLIQHGQDPFENLSEKYEVKLEISNSNSNKETIDIEKQNEDKIVEQLLKGKNNVNQIDLNLLISLLYNYITYTLIPSSKRDETTTNDDEDVNDGGFNLDMNLEDIVTVLAADQLDNPQDLKNSFDLNGFKLKNILFLWTLLVKLRFKMNN